MKAISDDFKPQRLGAVILAAGHSRRMGAFKPLLPFGSHTVIEQVIDSLQKAGVCNSVVVTGYRGEEITLVLTSKGIHTAFNPGFTEGMFSSLQAGIKRLEPETRAFFAMPGDMPLIRPSTLLSLAESFKQKSAIVSYPMFNGRRGHPPLLAMKLAERLLTWKGDGGLRAFLKPYQDQAVEIPVDDEGILLDLDHMEDYVRAMDRIDGIQESEFRRFQIGEISETNSRPSVVTEN